MRYSISSTIEIVITPICYKISYGIRDKLDGKYSIFN